LKDDYGAVRNPRTLDLNAGIEVELSMELVGCNFTPAASAVGE
jgi:hypothetical protein